MASVTYIYVYFYVKVGIKSFRFISICIVPAMMLANWLLDRLATAAWQVHDFYIYLVSLLFIAMINPYSLFQIHNF